MRRVRTLFLLFFSLFVISCSWEERHHTGEYSEVFIYCSLGFNNLSTYVQDDLTDLCKGILPARSMDKAILAFVHVTSQPGDYKTPTQPLLLQISREKGNARIDTLKRYSARTDSASDQLLNEMLLDIKELFPSKKYGMLFSSHATGWIKPLYRSSTEGFKSEYGADYSQPGVNYPLTKSIGAAFNGSSKDPNISEIDIVNFAASIPMKMEYIIFDACLMGSIEVAYELKDVCDMLIASPTEILATGMLYHNMSWNLLSSDKPDLEAISKEYFDYYNAQSGYEQSATISLIDCSHIDELSEICKEIFVAHKDKLGDLDRNAIQKYFYDGKRWFYDLRDTMTKIGATNEELRALDAVLAKCVLYHDETPKFFNLSLNNCCGLSIYIPQPFYSILNKYYRTLSWNTASGEMDAFGFE